MKLDFDFPVMPKEDLWTTIPGLGIRKSLAYKRWIKAAEAFLPEKPDFNLYTDQQVTITISGTDATLRDCIKSPIDLVSRFYGYCDSLVRAIDIERVEGEPGFTIEIVNISE